MKMYLNSISYSFLPKKAQERDNFRFRLLGDAVCNRSLYGRILIFTLSLGTALVCISCDNVKVVLVDCRDENVEDAFSKDYSDSSVGIVYGSLDKASLIGIRNISDDSIRLHGSVESNADPIRNLKIVGPDGSVVVEEDFRDTRFFVNTEVNFDTPRSSLEILQSTYPEGFYEFRVLTVNDELLNGTYFLSYVFLDAPHLIYPTEEQTEVPTKDLVISWTQVIDAQSIIIEITDENVGTFNKVNLPGNATELVVPNVWLQSDTNYIAKIKAIGSNGNIVERDVAFVTENTDDNVLLSFSATADIRHYSGSNIDYFRGACEAIARAGAGDFMISVGDIDPPHKVYRTVQDYIGNDYLWYPVVGNHEAGTKTDMSWLRRFNTGGTTLPYIVNKGPEGTEETTYSFDRANAHFVILNLYYDGTSDTASDGSISDALYNWLEADLKKNEKPTVFVIGHEPAFPQPDRDSGNLRHKDDCLNQDEDNRNRFWSLLVQHNVNAYICGHTHNYSIINVYDVWQIDVGHARGIADEHSQSTFVMFYIMESGNIRYNTYRWNESIRSYCISDTGNL